MSYRIKRPRMRSVLTFGIGTTLAITQLGAGCVPAREARPCSSDGGVDDAGNCTADPTVNGTDAGADGK